ncbi:MAG: NMD3-related protein [Thermoplasmata archaeon]
MVCGKETGSARPVCDECSKPKSTRREMVRVKVKRCPSCGSIMLHSWGDVDSRNIAASVVDRSFHVKGGEITTSGDERNLRVSYRGFSEELGKEIEGAFLLQISSSTCPVCTRKLGNYYEAVIQVRGGTGNLRDALSFIVKSVENAESRDVFITRIDSLKEGYDVLVSDKKYARAMVKRTAERFGGEVKETSHLVGLKDGNELYRITLSLRLPNFKRGDIVSLSSGLFIVKRIKGDVLTFVNIRTGSAFQSKFRDLGDYSVFSASESIREARVLYRQGNTAYILDPFDFREKAVLDSGSSTSIRVARIGDELLVINDN